MEPQKSPRADFIRAVQRICAFREDHEKDAAVEHVRMPGDKDLLQQALLASEGARVARLMRDEIINAVNQYWPTKEGK